MLLAVDTSAAPPYPYAALRIEPDRLSIIAYDGTTIRELDSAQGATAANTWYTVQLRIVAGGPAGGTLSVERVSGTAGEAVATLMQSVPLSELPEIENSAIGFTVGELAGYQFQLVKYADAPDLSESFVDWSYDAYGRKVAETVYDNANAVTSQTLYVWDGWRLVSELDGMANNRVVAEYVPGPTYVDDMVAARRDQNRDGDFNDANEAFLYYLTDQQHSTVALLDGTGAVAERYGYDAFGTPSFHDGNGSPIAASAVGNDRLYTGRQWLPALKLYDYRQRLYDPAMGRFLTTDPVYDPANLGNPYTYVGNNPGAFVDPYGERSFWNWIADGLAQHWPYRLDSAQGVNLETLTRQLRPDAREEWEELLGRYSTDTRQQLLRATSATANELLDYSTTALSLATPELAIGGMAAGGIADISKGDYGAAALNLVPIGVVGAAGKAKNLAIREAKALEGPNRGMIWVLEAQGDISKDYVKFEAALQGARSSVTTQKRIVPALRFDNPRANGFNFVRFDGVDPTNPKVLIDRKTAMTSFPKQQAAIERAADALLQNPGYAVVFEFPTGQAANKANSILTKLNVSGSISVRVSP